MSVCILLQLVQAKDEEIEKLREELRKLKQSYDDISNFCEESISTASALEQKAEDLKVVASHCLLKNGLVFLIYSGYIMNVLQTPCKDKDIVYKTCPNPRREHEDKF